MRSAPNAWRRKRWWTNSEPVKIGKFADKYVKFNDSQAWHLKTPQCLVFLIKHPKNYDSGCERADNLWSWRQINCNINIWATWSPGNGRRASHNKETKETFDGVKTTHQADQHVDESTQQVWRKLNRASDVLISANCCTHGRLRSFVDHPSLKVQIRDVTCGDDTLITMQTRQQRLAIEALKLCTSRWRHRRSTSHGS